MTTLSWPSGIIDDPKLPFTTTIIVKRLRPEAQLPIYATDGSSGFDLVAPQDIHVQKGLISKLHLGLAFEIPSRFELQIRPRSGMASRGQIAIFGTVDSDYRGEVSVLLTALHSDFHVRAGDRVAQGVIAPVLRARIVEAETLSPTSRGEGGFGSTGK